MARVVENLIVGGGITGMWLAHRLAEAGHRDTVIVTPDMTLGLVESIKFGGGRYRADLGGHVYTRQDPRVTALMTEAGAVIHEERKAVYLHRQGGEYVHIDYPVQNQAEALGIPIQSNRPAWTGQTLKEWAVESFGAPFYIDWFAPFNRRVWTADPKDMASDWIANRVAPSTPGDKGWGPNASFYYAHGDRLADALLTRIRGHVDVMLTKVVDVDPSTLAVTTERGLELAPKRIFWTAQLPALLSMTRPHLSNRPALAHNMVRTVCIAVDHDLELPFHWMYNTVDGAIHRVTNLSAYHEGNAPKGHSLLLLEYPYAMRHKFPSWAYPDTMWRQQGVAIAALMDNSKAQAWAWDTGIEIQDLDVQASIMLDFVGYPIPLVGERERIADAKRALAKKNIFVAGRWGDWAYYNIEHCMSSAEAAIEAAFTKARDSYFTSDHYYMVR